MQNDDWEISFKFAVTFEEEKEHRPRKKKQIEELHIRESGREESSICLRKVCHGGARV